MARVSKESLEKLNAFIDSLPPEARNKCALCTETLTHLGMTAQVKTGAPLATFARTMAEKINETAAPGDRVSGEALTQRVRYNEGLKCQSDRINNPQPQHDPPPRKEDDEPLSNWREKSSGQQAGKDDLEKQAQCTEAYQFETIAISQLRRIRKDDPDRVGALNRVKKWIESQLQGA